MGTKKIQKPFDLEAWKNGAKVETRDGRPVRIICTDLNSIYDERTLVAAVTTQHGDESVRRFCQSGRYFSNDEDEGDIVIVEEVEEPKPWAEDKKARGNGWYIDIDSAIYQDETNLNHPYNFNEFATEKQAKSALAMARISQLMAHDKRYGGVVTDEEWKSGEPAKCIIMRYNGRTIFNSSTLSYHFLAFHTNEQRTLFLSENERLVKDYLMI